MQLLCIPLVVIGLAALFSIPVAFVRPGWFRMASRRDAVLSAMLVAAYYLGDVCCGLLRVSGGTAVGL